MLAEATVEQPVTHDQQAGVTVGDSQPVQSLWHLIGRLLI
jgi:hypothetical protein